MKNNIIKKLLKVTIKELKYWGCAYETDLPPEFVITKHAQQKMEARFKCRKDKIKKVVIKAWYNNQEVNKKFIYYQKFKGYPTSVYKTFNGFIFVFCEEYNPRAGFLQKILITVYNPKTFR